MKVYHLPILQEIENHAILFPHIKIAYPIQTNKLEYCCKSNKNVKSPSFLYKLHSIAKLLKFKGFFVVALSHLQVLPCFQTAFVYKILQINNLSDSVGSIIG